MSEFSAILTPQDKVDFASWLHETFAAQFVIDDGREDTEVVDSVSRIAQILEQEFPPIVFVLSQAWSTLPLYKRKAKRGGSEFHYLMQRYGGPAFTWVPGNYFRKGQATLVSAGSFADYPYFYERPGDASTIQRPAAMVAAYKASLGWHRGQANRQRTKFKGAAGVGPWISERAYQLVAVGSAELANPGLEVVAHAA
jgi:hypothetical protein